MTPLGKFIDMSKCTTPTICKFLLENKLCKIYNFNINKVKKDICTVKY